MSGLVNNKPKEQNMIKIEFPAGRSDIALAIGQALITIGQTSARRSEVGMPAELGAGYAGWETKAAGDTRNAEDAAWAALAAGDTRNVEDAAAERAELYKYTAEPKAGETQTRGDSQGSYEHVGETMEERREDENGVEFNAKYCGEAAIPFYASGKRKGQWKKRKSVEEGVYDDWYANCSEDIIATTAPKDEPEPNPEKAANAFKKAPAATEDDAPSTFPELMTWFADQQAAGNYEAEHLEKAFQALNITTLDLVQDTTGDKVRAVYEYLA
jgi:hypothetical protein